MRPSENWQRVGHTSQPASHMPPAPQPVTPVLSSGLSYVDDTPAQTWSLPPVQPAKRGTAMSGSLGAPTNRQMDAFSPHEPKNHDPSSPEPQLHPSVEAVPVPPQPEPHKMSDAEFAIEQQIKLAEAEIMTPAEEERYAIFERLGRTRQQMMSVNLGSMDIDAHFDALEQSIAEDRKVAKTYSAPSKPAPIVRELDDFELMSELSTMELPSVEEDTLPHEKPAATKPLENSDPQEVEGAAQEEPKDLVEEGGEKGAKEVTPPTDQPEVEAENTVAADTPAGPSEPQVGEQNADPAGPQSKDQPIDRPSSATQ